MFTLWHFYILNWSIFLHLVFPISIKFTFSHVDLHVQYTLAQCINTHPCISNHAEVCWDHKDSIFWPHQFHWQICQWLPVQLLTSLVLSGHNLFSTDMFSKTGGITSLARYTSIQPTPIQTGLWLVLYLGAWIFMHIFMFCSTNCCWIQFVLRLISKFSNFRPSTSIRIFTPTSTEFKRFKIQYLIGLIIFDGYLQVLATGLSALYSRLPNTLDVPGEDWYCLENGLWTTLPELKSFITSLEFCNDVIQVSFFIHSCLHTCTLHTVLNSWTK